jgi:hypothetical protein
MQLQPLIAPATTQGNAPCTFWTTSSLILTAFGLGTTAAATRRD